MHHRDIYRYLALARHPRSRGALTPCRAAVIMQIENTKTCWGANTNLAQDPVFRQCRCRDTNQAPCIMPNCLIQILKRWGLNILLKRSCTEYLPLIAYPALRCIVSVHGESINWKKISAVQHQRVRSYHVGSTSSAPLFRLFGLCSGASEAVTGIDF